MQHRVRRIGIPALVLGLLLGGSAARGMAQQPATLRFRTVPSGRVRPLYVSGVPDSGVTIGRFQLAERPVSNGDFLRFVRARPEWRRSRVAPIAADVSYLRHWASDTALGGDVTPSDPVVHVSWFAARAYARWTGGRLPSTMEWEHAARRFRSPGGLFDAHVPGMGATLGRNISDDGVIGLHGGPWEWVEDFNSVVTSGESRGDAAPDDGLFCAGGAALAADPSDYAAFMRYAVRGALRGNFTLASVGFRIARDAEAGSGRAAR